MKQEIKKMIISHKHKFIFIKTRKTAGTSIEISLSRFCGKEDVITPITPEDEEIRKQFSIGPQNYKKNPNDSTFLKIKGIFSQKNNDDLFWNHIPAKSVKNIVGEKTWNSYYKFCFDRNPWDKTVSMFWWDQQQKTAKDFGFDDWFELMKKGILHYNYPLYSEDNEIIVDFVGKFENLEEDLTNVCNKIGIKFDGWLPRAKGNFRKDKKHYSKYFNKNQRKFIADYFEKEINLLNYSFTEK
jgi:hypothetical protein